MHSSLRAGPACSTEDIVRRYLEGVSQKLNSPGLEHSFRQLRAHCLSTLSTVGPSAVNPVSAFSRALKSATAAEQVDAQPTRTWA